MKRSRSHILESMSYAYVERCANKYGWIVRGKQSDYGIDAELEVVYNHTVTGKLILLQLKSTERNRTFRDGQLRYRCKTDHIRYWLAINLPVLLVVYSSINDRAYWIWIQQYVREVLDVERPTWSERESVTVRLPIANDLASSFSRIERIPDDHKKMQVEDYHRELTLEGEDPSVFIKTIRRIQAGKPDESVTEAILNEFKPIEKGILELRNTRIVRESYYSFLNERLRRTFGIGSVNAITKALEESDLGPMLVQDVYDHFRCNVSVAWGLSNLRYSVGKRSWEITDPELLWDCCCKFSKKEDCRLHALPGVDRELDPEFRNMTFICHGGLQFFYHDVANHSSVWPPSFESLYFGELISGLQLDDIKTVVDIGCGTGYLGIVAAKSLGCRQLVFSDWLPSPLIAACINWHLNRQNMKVCDSKTNFICCDRVDDLLRVYDTPFDLAICNPPFLPDLGFPSLNTASTVFGIDLLTDVLRKARLIGKTTLVAFSDIVMREVKSVLRSADEKMEILNSEGFRMPFRVTYALDHKRYLKKLVTSGRLAYEPNSPHKYYHKIFYARIGAIR